MEVAVLHRSNQRVSVVLEVAVVVHVDAADNGGNAVLVISVAVSVLQDVQEVVGTHRASQNRVAVCRTSSDSVAGRVLQGDPRVFPLFGLVFDRGVARRHMIRSPTHTQVVPKDIGCRVPVWE